MITERMSFEEITKEYDKIHTLIEPRVKSKIESRSNKMRRYLIENKEKENIWFSQLDFQIDNNTIFCALPYTRGWKEFQKMGNHPYLQFYLLYLTKTGFTLLTRGGDYDDKYAFFTSHLFDRYRERALKDLSLDKRSVVIQEFFKNNGNICSIEFPTEKEPNNYLGITERGVIFGERITDKIMLYKTFIRKEDLKKHQFEVAAETEEGLNAMLQYLQQIQELTFKKSRL